MKSEHAHALYRELLYQHGHGYPFWIPQPDDALPAALKAEGIWIGDLGILTDDGGFEYLWNVHGDHRRNKCELPPHYTPLKRFEDSDVRRVDNMFDPNDVISSSNVKTLKIQFGANGDLAIPGGTAGGGFGVEFSADGNSGAILTLPRGGSRFDAGRLDLYQQHAADNARIWYEHLNRSLGRRVKNGALYLITGADKCSSWGVASFAESNASQGFSLQFHVPGASANASVTNTWVASHGVPHRTGVVPDSETSQCVFARGFVIAVRHTLWTRLFKLDPRPDVQAIDSSGGLPSFVQPNPPYARGGVSEDSYPPSMQPLAEPSLLSQQSPAALLAEVFLEKKPDASFAVIHDNNWIEPVKRGELAQSRASTGAFFEDLRGYAMKSINVVVDKGVCMIPDPDAMPKRVIETRSYALDAAGSLSRQSDGKANMFALVIGINKYKNTGLNLRGAAPDADAVSEYLAMKLGLDNDHIRNLRDDEATRDAILKAISAFESDQRIQPGDSILIYYAGHGAEADPPSGWEAGGPTARIQMILPHDFSATSSAPDEQGIQDLYLGQLISEIAQKKGDNITVIFDCCHSASGTRNPLDNPLDNPLNLNVLTRGVELPKGYQVLDPVRKSKSAPASLASHVLLAACSQGETAREGGTPSRGFFTSALLKLLHDLDERTVTYRDVFDQLPDLAGQHPQCEGINRDRFLFDGKAAARRSILYSVVSGGEGHELRAGHAHGIAEGATFDIYAIPDSSSQRICTLIVSATEPFSARLERIPESPATSTLPFPNTAWALQRTIGKRADLTVSLYPEEKFVNVKNMVHGSTGGPPLRFVAKDDSYELAVRAEDGRAVFMITDQISAVAGLTRLPATVSIDNTDQICAVIEAAAHFFYHLRRSKTPEFVKQVVVEAFELEVNEDGIDVPRGPDLVVNGMVQLMNPTEETDYGFKLTSNFDAGLYASAFLFNMSDFKIQRVYEPGYAKNGLDVSVRANGSLTFGYGPDLGDRIGFALGQLGVDVTYLKVFLSSEPVHLAHIPQESPFDGGRYSVSKPPRKGPVWGSVLLPIVQKKV